jgi:CheY-like chemotaxis protein
MNLLEQMRVLVVDDNERDRQLSNDVVNECVPGAMIDFANDYESALPLLLSKYYDLVLLDLVLHDDWVVDPGAAESWEGPWLLQDLLEHGLNQHVPVIILTNFARPEVALILFRNFQIADFWTKTEPKENLVASLRSVLDKESCFGLECNVRFEGDMSWRSMAANIGLPRRLSSPVSPEDAEIELRHIVRKLFSNRKEVVVSTLRPDSEGSHGGAGVCFVTPYGFDGRSQATLMMKFGAFEQIVQECTRWSDIRKYMHSFRMTPLEGSVLGRQLGVLAYGLVGANSGQVQPFAQFYVDGSVNQICGVVRTLFEENVALCYHEMNRSQMQRLNLRELYTGYLGFTSETVRQACLFKFPDKPIELTQIGFPGISRRFSHPIAAFYKGEADFTIESWTCRTHGDMHTGNILVDNALEKPWLIDFGRAGHGHWARDFVALEASIKFQIVPPKDLGALFEFEAALVKQDDLVEMPEYHREDQAELCKAAEVIGELRRIAGTIDDRSDRRASMIDYYAALFYQTINYVRLHSLIKSPIRKNQVLMSAALLCEKLNSYFRKA